MRSEYSVEIFPDYLYVHITGEYDIKDFKAYAAIIAEEGRKADRKKILVDGTGVNDLDISVLDRFILGEEVAYAFGYKFKAAFVWPRKYSHKIMEMTAQNRGARIEIFWNMKEAMEWLLKDVATDS